MDHSSSLALRTMRIILGMLMVVNATVDNEVTINGTVEDSVLLPCNCSGRNLEKMLQWQMDKPTMKLVLKHNGTTLEVSDRYKGRVETFVTENSSNCSFRLTNITADDRGKYKCIFHIQEQYTRFYINLNLFANYVICEDGGNWSSNLSREVFQCNVTGRYRDAEIDWYLDGKLLTNSSTTYISHTRSVNSPGLYQFRNELITELRSTSKPKCYVKTKGVTSNISYDCIKKPDKYITDIRPPKCFMKYFKIIPIALVLGFSLFLWRCSKFSQKKSEPRIREAEPDNSC